MKIEKVKYSNRTKNFDVSRRFLSYVKMYVFNVGEESQTAGIFFKDFFFFVLKNTNKSFFFK